MNDDVARSNLDAIKRSLLRSSLGVLFALVLSMAAFALYKLARTCAGACAYGLFWVVVVILALYIAVCMLPLFVPSGDVDHYIAWGMVYALKGARWLAARVLASMDE